MKLLQLATLISILNGCDVFEETTKCLYQSKCQYQKLEPDYSIRKGFLNDQYIVLLFIKRLF